MKKIDLYHKIKINAHTQYQFLQFSASANSLLCPIHIPTQSFNSPNTNLTYSITTLANYKSSNLVYQFQQKKCKVFSIGEMGQMLWKHVNGHRFPSTPNSNSSLSRNTNPSMSFTNSQTPPPTMSTVNLKRHINLYFNPNSLPVSTSDNLSVSPTLTSLFSPSGTC